MHEILNVYKKTWEAQYPIVELHSFQSYIKILKISKYIMRMILIFFYVCVTKNDEKKKIDVAMGNFPMCIG